MGSAQKALALDEAIDVVGADQDDEADQNYKADEMHQSLFIRGHTLTAPEPLEDYEDQSSAVQHGDG